MNSSNRLLVPPDNEFGVNNLDAVRLLLALMVVWSHCFALYLGAEANEPLSMLTRGLYNSGNVGVLGFFAISGLLISHSFIRSRTVSSYLLKRVRRIYPGFIAATVFGALIVGPVFATVPAAFFTPEALLRFFASVCVLQFHTPADAGPFPSNPAQSINGALWSIPFEFWCYLGVAALGVAGLLRKGRIILLALAATLLTKTWLDLTGRKPGGGVFGLVFGWPYLWFQVLPPFLCGMAAYAYRHRIPRRYSILAGLLALAIGGAWLPEPRLAEAVARFAAPFAISYAVLMVGFSRRPMLRAVTRTGDYSYGTYLYAFPIQQAIRAIFGSSLPFAAYVPVCIAASLLAGVLSWRVVERPFLPRARTHGRSGDAAPPAAASTTKVE